MGFRSDHTAACQAGIGTVGINPNHREHTRVAAGLGNRGQIREELPLSTRVHELAKELGLKSQELLERIQKWGLDVKANALASLDPAVVDRIRELMDQPASGKGTASNAAPSAPVPPHQVCPLGLRRARRARNAPAAPGASGPVPATSGQAPARPGPACARLAAVARPDAAAPAAPGRLPSD